MYAFNKEGIRNKVTKKRNKITFYKGKGKSVWLTDGCYRKWLKGLWKVDPKKVLCIVRTD